MPRYDYACEACGSISTLTRSMRDSDNPVACDCGAPCRKKPTGFLGLVRGAKFRPGSPKHHGASPTGPVMPTPTALHLSGNSAMQDCWIDGAGVSVSGPDNAILGSAILNADTAISTDPTTSNLLVKGNIHMPRAGGTQPNSPEPSSALVLGDAEHCTFQRVDSQSDVLVTGIARNSYFSDVSLRRTGEASKREQ